MRAPINEKLQGGSEREKRGMVYLSPKDDR